MKDTVRTFIAFELPESIIQLAADLQMRLKSHGLKLRWVRPQNMHLTVKFLGDVATGRIGDVAEAMHRASGNAMPIAVAAQGLGVFPGIRKPRVLWFGLGGRVDLLSEAHRLLEEELEERGFARERRPFRAHLTLARIKHEMDFRRLLEGIQDVGSYQSVEFQLTEWVLFRSDLRPQGAFYTPLERMTLSGT